MAILGIPDPWIWGAYLGCILSVIFCVVYGFMKGTKEDDSDE